MRFDCPSCAQSIEVALDATDARVPCPRCGKTVPVPPKTQVTACAATASAETGRLPAPAIALASLITGLLSIPTCCLIGPPMSVAAIVCGHIGRATIRNSTRPMDGDGMCVAGMLLGYLNIAFFVLAIVFWILFIGIVTTFD